LNRAPARPSFGEIRGLDRPLQSRKSMLMTAPCVCALLCAVTRLGLAAVRCQRAAHFDSIFGCSVLAWSSYCLCLSALPQDLDFGRMPVANPNSFSNSPPLVPPSHAIRGSLVMEERFASPVAGSHVVQGSVSGFCCCSGNVLTSY
jgi:hypothetical protein